jgi:hypothetical protein
MKSMVTKAQCIRSGKYNVSDLIGNKSIRLGKGKYKVSDRINSQITKDHIYTKVGKYDTSNKGCFAGQFRITI